MSFVGNGNDESCLEKYTTDMIFQYLHVENYSYKNINDCTKTLAGK